VSSRSKVRKFGKVREVSRGEASARSIRLDLTKRNAAVLTAVRSIHRECDHECACAPRECIARDVECKRAAARLRATAVPRVRDYYGSGKGKSVMRGHF